MSTVRELLARGKGGDPAIVIPGGPTLTFDELRRQIDGLAAQLNAYGIRRNDRVAIVLPNGPAAAIVFLAVAACATAAPLNPAYREDEFRFYLDDLGAAALITLPDDAPDALASAPVTVLRLALTGQPGSFSLQKEGQGVDIAEPLYATA